MPSIFDSVIDLGTSDGRKMYTMACKPLGVILKSDGTNKLAFRNAFKDRVRTCVWMNHLMIHNDTADEHGNDLYEDIIDRTALITIEQVRNARALRNTNGDERELLDVEMMYECLKTSIEEDVTTSIATKYEDINRDGTMLWKVLMDALTNKATKQQVRLWKATLRSLNLTNYDNNIKLMNTEVAKIVLNLSNADQEPEDLADHILAAYKRSPCNEFAVYITSLENEADRADRDLDADALMDQGLTKYDALVTSGDYANSDPKDAQILALQTQLQNLEDTVTKKRPKNDKTRSSTGKGATDTAKRKGREAWQLVAPKTGEPTSKTVNGRTFHWCTKPHGHDGVPIWGVHEPAKHKDVFKRQKVADTPAEDATPQAHVGTIELDESAFNEDTDDETEE
jgi:hypothetical protein